MQETIDKKANALSKQEEQQRQLREGGNVSGKVSLSKSSQGTVREHVKGFM